MLPRFARGLLLGSALCLTLSLLPQKGTAQALTSNVVQSYADLADLSDSAAMVEQVEIKSVIPLLPAQQAGVAKGHLRAYVEARPINALRGETLYYPLVRYLVDLPVNDQGKLPKLTKTQAVIFAREAGGTPGDLQLVAPDAQLAWSAPLEANLRFILGELTAPEAPPRVTGISMAFYQPGDLAGEGETQMFLTTANSKPAAIVVQHRAGEPLRWTASFAEVVDPSVTPPAVNTLGWYRLACFLPATLPPSVNLGETPEAKAQAAQDYLAVRAALGPCGRQRK